MRRPSSFMLLVAAGLAGGCMALPELPVRSMPGDPAPHAAPRPSMRPDATPPPIVMERPEQLALAVQPTLVVAPILPADRGQHDGERDLEPTEPPRVLEPSTRLTPMTRPRAARLLSRAWRRWTGSEAPPQTLSILLSHWAFETGRGQKMIGFNFAGLKGVAPGGGSCRLWTQERHGSTVRRVLRRFRAYRSAEAGAHDYVGLLTQRYPKALRAARRGSVVDFVLALDEAGYFTDDVDVYLRAMRSLWLEYSRDPVAVDASARAAAGRG